MRSIQSSTRNIDLRSKAAFAVCHGREAGAALLILTAEQHCDEECCDPAGDHLGFLGFNTWYPTLFSCEGFPNDHSLRKLSSNGPGDPIL